MKLPGFLTTKNVLIGSGVASTLSGIVTVACAVMGGEPEPAPTQPPMNDSASNGIAPLEDGGEEPEG